MLIRRSKFAAALDRVEPRVLSQMHQLTGPHSRLDEQHLTFLLVLPFEPLLCPSKSGGERWRIRPC